MNYSSACNISSPTTKAPLGLFPATAQPIAAGAGSGASDAPVRVPPTGRARPEPTARTRSATKVILTALSALTDVKVISAPSVVVMDKEPAFLQVGDEVPISTGVATVLSSPSTPGRQHDRNAQYRRYSQGLA